MKRLRLIAIACFLFLSVGVTAAQMNPCEGAGGVLTNGTCSLDLGVKISIEYPLDLAQNDLVARTVDAFIKQTKNDFLINASGEYILGEHYGPDVLDVRYEEVEHSNRISSLVFKIFEYTGGVHGSMRFQTYTFDLKANKLLSFNDLFLANTNPIAVLAPLVEASLVQALSRNSVNADFNDVGNYQSFALDQDALIFYFRDYQVADYSAGEPVIRIPLSLLSGVHKPELAS